MNIGIHSASRWHARCCGTLRNRVVLRYLGAEVMMPFVIHREIENEYGTTDFEWGTYFNSLVEAETEFYKKAHQFEKDYREFLEPDAELDLGRGHTKEVYDSMRARGWWSNTRDSYWHKEVHGTEWLAHYNHKTQMMICGPEHKWNFAEITLND